MLVGGTNLVISELNGLLHNPDFAENCRIALKLIKTQLEMKTISIQTSNGEEINSATLRERWEGRCNADDAILRVCELNPNTCLITDDKNMRLKARSMNLTVTDITKAQKLLNE